MPQHTIPDTGPYVDAWYGQYAEAQALLVAAALAPVDEHAQTAAVHILDTMGPTDTYLEDTERERLDEIVREALEAAEEWLNNHRAYPGRTTWGPSETGDAWGHWADVDPDEWPEIEYTATIVDGADDLEPDADPIAAEGWTDPTVSAWSILAHAHHVRLEPYTPDGGYDPAEFARRLADAIQGWTGHVDHLDTHADRLTAYPSDAVTDYSGTYGTPLARYQALRHTHARYLTPLEADAVRVELENRGALRP